MVGRPPGQQDCCLTTMMITYRTRWLKYGERWFDEGKPDSKIDVVYHHMTKSPVVGSSNQEFYTLVVDLSQSEHGIQARFDRNTRAKIRRAVAQDGLRYEMMSEPSPAELAEFIDFYNEFARDKALQTLQCSYLERLRSAGILTISRVISDGRTLVWHSHIRAGQRAMAWHSASLFRRESSEVQHLIGRANRFHHLKDMLFHKEKGCHVYDFGGWYEGVEDQDRLQINRFKKEFGGTMVRHYNAVEYKTLRAKLLKSIARFL
jgi:hypothetical protein